MNDGTIAAIATATGGGIGIVRISGARAEAILRALAPSLPAEIVSHRLVRVEVFDPSTREPLDDVLAVIMRGPNSFTGEDVAELHAHGGAANLARILSVAITQGARLATPGEFSRRAFTAGKIDLSQAEAIAALIGARDARSLRAAQGLRRGALGRRVTEARTEIVHALAELEGALDFPEDTANELPRITAAQLQARAAALAAYAAAYRRPLGVLPEVMLVGRVNAGKSSLLNALAGHERALVDDQPGTTRDLVEAEIDVAGDAIRLVDTAGERTDADGVEARGQAMARARRSEAALVLLVVDGALGWQPIDERVLQELVDEKLSVLVVANKADLLDRPHVELIRSRPGKAQPPLTTLRSTRSSQRESGGAASIPRAALPVSARTGTGLAELRSAIKGGLDAGRDEEQPIATARQAEAITLAADAIARAASALAEGVEEASAVELRHALHHLGQVTGETADEEVLDAIFARFCIGK